MKELKGFQRITLDPGEKKSVTLNLPVKQLAFYNEKMKKVVEPGLTAVMIGSSSEDIRLQGVFEIE
jgi:beta-glucosidase